MYRSAFVAALMAGGVCAAPARAASEPCPVPTGSTAYQATLSPLLGGITPTASPQPGSSTPVAVPTPSVSAFEVARSAVGPQFVEYWLSTPLQGWAVGIAPGAMDVVAARAAILQALNA